MEVMNREAAKLGLQVLFHETWHVYVPSYATCDLGKALCWDQRKRQARQLVSRPAFL